MFFQNTIFAKIGFHFRASTALASAQKIMHTFIGGMMNQIISNKDVSLLNHLVRRIIYHQLVKGDVPHFVRGKSI